MEQWPVASVTQVSADGLIPVAGVRPKVTVSPTTGIDDAILGAALGDGFSLPDLMAGVARHYLDRAMEQSRGNKTEAAKLLGLGSYQTLTNWLLKYQSKKAGSDGA